MIGPRQRACGVAAVVAACLLAPATDARGAATLDWRRPWVPLRDTRAATTVSDEYAWRLFVAVNWPGDWRTRAADAGARLGADWPTVWETWANTSQIFRDDGADPGKWRRTAQPPGLADAARFETSSLKDLPNLRHIVAGRMMPVVDPVSNARRLTEIRMNRAAYDYIRAHELYNLDGQLKMLAAHRRVNFPAATMEVKAKWRPIAAAQRPRYHTVEVRQADGTVRLYGLVALHVVTKDLPQWFWATFEHVDNPTLPDADGWRLPSVDRFACAAERADCNHAPAGIGLESGVWQFYRLRGTLTRYVDVDGRPLRLANSELEAGLQATSSCITCHSRASVGLAAGLAVHLPIFDNGSDALLRDPARRVGFVGLPQADWFNGGGTDPGARPALQPLDFVWSLAKAKPKRGS